MGALSVRHLQCWKLTRRISGFSRKNESTDLVNCAEQIREAREDVKCALVDRAVSEERKDLLECRRGPLRDDLDERVHPSEQEARDAARRAGARGEVERAAGILDRVPTGGARECACARREPRHVVRRFVRSLVWEDAGVLGWPWQVSADVPMI